MRGVIITSSPQEAQWRAAFDARDPRWDGRFVAAVKTTIIYCRASCPARRPKPENVRFFVDGAEAEAAGYRACKRCKPNEAKRDHQAVTRAAQLLKQGGRRWLLADLAAEVGYSPAHLQRIFKKSVGLSPAAYARALRQEKARDALSDGGSVTDAIYKANYGSASGFYAEMDGKLGMTASVWVNGGAGEVISWTIAPTSLGPMLLATSTKGVCRLSFGEGRDALEERFPKAELIDGGQEFAALTAQVVAQVERPDQAHNIPLDIAGTAFQERIWQALMDIPAGETRSYAEIAAAAGNPKATRAAGSANGANSVAVLVPCHRVIRSDGGLGGYAYGTDIKRELLKREAGEG